MNTIWLVLPLLINVTLNNYENKVFFCSPNETDTDSHQMDEAVVSAYKVQSLHNRPSGARATMSP